MLTWLLALQWQQKEAKHKEEGTPAYHEFKIKCNLKVPAKDRAAAASQRGAVEAELLAQVR